MTDVFKFQRELAQKECSCPKCEIANDYYEFIIDAESPQEVKYLVDSLVEEAALTGFKDALASDLNFKIDLLNYIDGECDCDTCDGSCEFN